MVQEFPDAVDKRSKRIQTTNAGIEILRISLPWMEKISDMAFNQLLESEKALLIELLNRINDFHKTHYLNVRNANLEVAYETLVSQS